MTDSGNEELAPQVKVKSYMRNGHVVRAAVRRGRAGRGTAGLKKAGFNASNMTEVVARKATGTRPGVGKDLAGQPSGTDYEGVKPGLPYPLGAQYGGGVWRLPNGDIYGYSEYEDGPIRKTRAEAKADVAKPGSASAIIAAKSRRGNPKDRKR